MDVYLHLLQTACSTWFKEHYHQYYAKATGHYSLISKSDRSFSGLGGDELPGMVLSFPVGPWKSVYIWFKSPGQVLSPEEKENLNAMRSQGHRVAIVRHLEDFKTLIHTLLYPVKEKH